MKVAQPELFEAKFLMPEGWMVLTPWISTPDDYKYRAHILVRGYGREAEVECRRFADGLNKAIDLLVEARKF